MSERWCFKSQTLSSPRRRGSKLCMIPAFAGMTCWVLFSCVSVQAAEKTWNASGDGASWFDEDNWLPTAVPTSADDVLINTQDAAVDVSQTFEVKSLTLAGTIASRLTVDPLIFGTAAPAEGSDLAIHNRRDGLLTLRGSTGTVVLRGKYKDSEEILANQPSLVFFVE